MLVEIVNNKIVGKIKISDSTKEQEFLKANPSYVKSEFNFVEALDLYEYDEANTTFHLVSNWEAIKANREAERLAEIEASKPSLEELKLIKIRELKEKTDSAYKEYLKKYPEIEVESFKNKADEANRVLLDNQIPLSQTPYLTALTGNTTIENRNLLAESVREKVVETAQLESQAVVKRNQIKACMTMEELEAIEI